MSEFNEYKELIMADRQQNKEDHNLLFKKFDTLMEKIEKLSAKVDNMRGSLSVWQIIFRGLVGVLVIEKIVQYLKAGN